MFASLIFMLAHVTSGGVAIYVSFKVSLLLVFRFFLRHAITQVRFFSNVLEGTLVDHKHGSAAQFFSLFSFFGSVRLRDVLSKTIVLARAAPSLLPSLSWSQRLLLHRSPSPEYYRAFCVGLFPADFGGRAFSFDVT